MQSAELAHYRFWLLLARRYRPHLLSEPEEKIVNLKDVGSLDGYSFVVALDPANSPDGLWAYPQAVLQGGIPVDYRNGFRFTIRNFKSITMTHGLGPEGELPPILRILVYDRSGNLLRKEDMEVKAEG